MRNSVIADSLTIAYERVGAGEPLLLLHGYGRPQIEDLSDEYTVIAWDAPGFGGSDDPPETWGLAEFLYSTLGHQEE